MIITSERETCEKDYYFGAGDFSFCYNKFEERYLYRDFKAINKIPGAWEFIKEGKFDQSQMLEEIRKDCWEDHTNKSFMHCMNEMNFIANFGWDKYANPLCY